MQTGSLTREHLIGTTIKALGIMKIQDQATGTTEIDLVISTTTSDMKERRDTTDRLGTLHDLIECYELIMDYKEKEYSAKIKTATYRHVTKKTTWPKKYYYMVGTSGKDTVTITMKSGSTYTG